MKKIINIGLLILMISCTPTIQKENIMENSNQNSFKIQKTEEEWKQELTPEQYYVLRQAGTERPFTGQYNMHFEKGTYSCGACGEPLFTSESKFDGHCGWPSFDKEIEEGKILERTDTSHGMVRTEILCANCGSHLGHVFDDGPTETGLRYCVNSLSLDFEEDSAK
jgi:peptide-methionine (R)-S-oxide reductase